MYAAIIGVLLAHFAAGANLRFQQDAPVTSLGSKRFCKPGYQSLLEEKVDDTLVPTGAAGSGLGKRGGVVADGYSRVACENDIAPESQRISFKEHACGKGLKSCRLTELGMTPRLCFDFCRQYENAKFFGLIHGRDCYCSVYFHAKTTGGGGCNAVCEGDKKQMCGGMEKSSLFEMHMCADSASEAEQAAKASAEAVKKSQEIVKAGTTLTKKLLALGAQWPSLGVCSIAPEGKRVCELNGEWTGIANQVTSAVAETTHTTEVLLAKTKTMTSAQEALKKAGDKATAPQMSAVELATNEVKDAAAKVHGAVAVMTNTMKTINGAAAGAPLKSFEVFKPLGNVKKDWYAICALKPVPGESYVAVAKDDPAACASHCLSMTGGACAAFNYQYMDGLATCQMLTSSGVVEPEDAINAAVPIFEVSKTKRDDMKITSLGCYAHGAFTAGHPKGPLGTKVVKQVTK